MVGSCTSEISDWAFCKSHWKTVHSHLRKIRWVRKHHQRLMVVYLGESKGAVTEQLQISNKLFLQEIVASVTDWEWVLLALLECRAIHLPQTGFQ